MGTPRTFTIALLTSVAGAIPTPVPSAAREATESCFLSPCALHLDLDDDGGPDEAQLVDSNGKKGIRVKFATGRLVLIGAGHDFGNAGDDAAVFDAWRVVKRETLDRALPAGDALLLEKSMSASGMIYCPEARCLWLQVGD